MNLVKSHPAFNKLFINNDQHALPMIINALIENSENCSFGEFCDAFMKFADDYTNSGLRYGMPDYLSKEAIASKIKGDIFEILSMFVLQKIGTCHDVGIKEGTYKQINDEEDCGLDFYGVYGRDYGRRAFGQVKFRNPNVPINGETVPFSRITKNKLAGEACTEFGCDLSKDILIFVTNLRAEDAMSISLKNVLGWTGTNPDRSHRYIKICDKTTFENIIGYNSISFWEEFRACFE
jgi:hypothetical protein